MKMIPAYSPEARGRSERNFGAWQGRLPQELRLRGISTREGVNEFLREHCIEEFNERFAIPAAKKGSAFVRLRWTDLDWIFSVQQKRTVDNDNTVALDNRVFQLEKTRWRKTPAGRPWLFMSKWEAAHLSATVPMWWLGMRLISCRPKPRDGVENRDFWWGERRNGSACGSEVLDRRLSRFPLRGQAGGTAASAGLRLGCCRSGRRVVSERDPERAPFARVKSFASCEASTREIPHFRDSLAIVGISFKPAARCASSKITA